MSPKIKFNVPKPSEPVENLTIELPADKVSFPSPTENNFQNGEGVSLLEEVLAPHVEKKRGRPPKDKVVPLDIAPPIDGVEEAPKKRGRKPGSKKTPILTAQEIGKQVFGLHQMLNVVFPGTEISRESADMMGESIQEVMEAFDIVINRKVTALIGLAATVAIVEFPVALKVRATILERTKSGKVNAKPLEMVRKKTVESGEPLKESINPLVDGLYIEKGVPM